MSISDPNAEAFAEGVNPIARYNGELSEFRADVTMAFMNTEPIEDSHAWRYYVLEPGAELENDNPIDVLIWTCVEDVEINGHPQKRPYIRILSSQKYDTPHGVEYFTVDVTVDEDNDSQYIVGAFPFNGGDLGPGSETAFVPFFCINAEGELEVSENYTPYTITHGISYELKDKKRVVRPFGHYHSLEDRQQALDVARKIFDSVRNSEPIATSQAKG